ncbi:hypothetical protein, partial [Salmonella sp. s51090]|uniref:hypothetical protein n=1 Tax=Salmonella sp. s51090 TaxID=3159651 RepID=UPI00397F47D2
GVSGWGSFTQSNPTEHLPLRSHSPPHCSPSTFEHVSSHPHIPGTKCDPVLHLLSQIDRLHCQSSSHLQLNASVHAIAMDTTTSTNTIFIFHVVDQIGVVKKYGFSGRVE